MSSMSCSKEEIEKKRLAALQKRQSKSSTTDLFSHVTSPVVQKASIFGPLKSVNVASKPFHPYFKPDPRSQTNSGVLAAALTTGRVVSGTVYLISEHRFEVNPSEFSAALINVFKTIPSRSYDGKSRLWNFSMEDYPELISKVAPLAPNIVLGPIPPYVLKVLKEPQVDPSSVDLSPIEATLREKLMDFQEEGVRFGISKRGRCMIADDMGLGKTFQALAIASYYRQDWPLLIVTTSSMREVWQEKIRELLPSVPLLGVCTLSSSRDAALLADKQTQVAIVSYKMCSLHQQMLVTKNFGVVIIDESHFLKSHKAQCTAALGAACARAARLVLLSGTPALSRPAELYTQLQLLDKRAFYNFTEYGKRYCGGKLTNFGWDMSGQSHLSELQVVLRRRFLIRRTKDQVLSDQLEAKTRETVLLDAALLESSREQQQQLSQLAQKFVQTKSKDKQAALLSFFSESARVKIPAICKYIRQLVKENKEGGKFLVFAHHKPVVEAVCLTLDELATHYICIVGSTRPDIRADLVDRFQASPQCRCAVLSVTAASSGLTLTAASLVLFTELHWNPGVLTQAEARAHRLGQRGSVCVRYLLARGTCDDYMWPMLQDKLNVLNDVGLSKDTFEDSTVKEQQSQNSIEKYLSPRSSKNKDEFIPGTNIRKKTTSTLVNTEVKKYNDTGGHIVDENLQNGAGSHLETPVTEFGSHVGDAKHGQEDDFLMDEEGDELLANIDF